MMRQACVEKDRDDTTSLFVDIVVRSRLFDLFQEIVLEKWFDKRGQDYFLSISLFAHARLTQKVCCE
jgi:hypothetical protein